MKIAFCGYDFFVDCVDALVNDGHEVVALFSEQSDNVYHFNTEITGLSAALDLPIKYAEITESDIEKLDAMGCDVLISAAYSHKVPSLEGTGIKGINIHPTKLPEGKGPWPLPWLILKEKTETALTFHKLSDKFDSGDILYQASVQMSSDETIESLMCKLQIHAPAHMLYVLDHLDELWQNAEPQAEGDYWPMVEEEDRVLDPNQTVAQIKKVSRAFGRFVSVVDLDEEVYDVERVDVWQEEHNFPIGEEVHRTSREIVFAAKDGFVCLTHFKIAED